MSVHQTINGVSLIELPKIHDPRGDLTFLEGGEHIPFEIARVYYLYNVPVNSQRGGHAHKDLQQVVFALSGSFRSSAFWLRDPSQGIYISSMIWREIDNFSQGAVCMVIASKRYEESDYIRDYDHFSNICSGNSK